MILAAPPRAWSNSPVLSRWWRSVSGQGWRHDRSQSLALRSQLLKLAAADRDVPGVDTVLIEQETIYMPRHGNDRFLLGFKHSLNECKLGLLRQRPLSA